MVNAKQLVDLQETLYSSSNPTRRWLHCSRRDWIVDAIHRFQPAAPNRSLEVGPGSGIYLPVLADIYQEVYAVDIEEAYLDNARQLLDQSPNLVIKTDNIISSRMPDAHFDFILCTEVIEHIKESQKALVQMWRILKPGGILLLSTPQRYSPLEISAKVAFLPGIIQLVRLIYQEPILETGHINLLTESELRHQIKSAKFDIIESHKTGLYIPLIAEFMGNTGLRLEQSIERAIRGGALDWLLWTQYFVLKKG